MAKLVPVQILGANFSLKTEENPEDLEKVITYFQERISETQKKVPITDPLKVAIITGIILSDELLKEQLKGRDVLSPTEASELEEITKRLIEKIDVSLTN